MTGQPPSPALSDDELRETLDLLSTVLASVSDRVDSQTTTMDRLVKTATEARQAAFAARQQTDPESYGDIIAETLNQHTRESFTGLVKLADLLRTQTEQTIKILDKAGEDQLAILVQIRDREKKAERLKHRLPWFGLGTIVLALVLAVTLPRFSAVNGATCAVLGGQWLSDTSGQNACVHYQE